MRQRKRDLATVPLSAVLNTARSEFQATPKYKISVPAGEGTCPTVLQVDNYSLTVTVKTTATGEVKVSGAAKGALPITWSIGPEWDDSSGATTSTAVSWQSSPIEEQKATHGSWAVVKDKPASGTWTTVSDPPAPSVWKMVPFDDAAAAKIRTSVTPGATDIKLEQLPTLNDLVQSALHEVIASSHAKPCVYPTGVEFHTGFEVVSMVGHVETVGLVFFGVSHEATSKTDVVQDLDLKATFAPGAVTVQGP